MNNIIKNIKQQVEKGVWVSPFLFVSKNLEILNTQVEEIALELLKEYEIPKSYLYSLKDNWEKIKIKELKSFVEFKDSKPPYRFQIFLIENISRLTETSSNSLLKLFEEPWKFNIIFTTNIWENKVLDTILSRVQKVDLWWNTKINKNQYYNQIISDYINNVNNDLIAYTFKSKLEKTDYIELLENIVIYLKENFSMINYIEEIFEEINLIKQNNLNAKYIFEKWIIKIKK